MKQIVSDHAVAIGSSFLAESATGETEMQMYECGNTGILFALEGVWLEEQDEEKPLGIPSFTDEGTTIILVDNENEIDLNIKAIGNEHDESLIDNVLTHFKEDIYMGDLTAIAELLHFVPKEVLNNYLGVE